jgi:NADH-quinone oxidoreductase subunit N
VRRLPAARTAWSLIDRSWPPPHEPRSPPSPKGGAAVIQFPAEQLANLHRLAPEIVLCLFGIVIMLADPFVGCANNAWLGWLAFVGSLGARVNSVLWRDDPGMAYSNLISADAIQHFCARRGDWRRGPGDPRLASITWTRKAFSAANITRWCCSPTAGMGILAGANELVTAFVGLEMSSISTTSWPASAGAPIKSNEASLKYFILGSFATAFFLYGIAMVYGATGTTRVDQIQPRSKN